MAFQPRVIKQNRGSSGEGIWIIKLKSGNYCTLEPSNKKVFPGGLGWKFSRKITKSQNTFQVFHNGDGVNGLVFTDPGSMGFFTSQDADDEEFH